MVMTGNASSASSDNEPTARATTTDHAARWFGSSARSSARSANTSTGGADSPASAGPARRGGRVRPRDGEGPPSSRSRYAQESRLLVNRIDQRDTGGPHRE